MKWLPVVLSLLAPTLYAHDVITTAITFDREIVRILLDKCASCHHPDGPAFSMLTYGEARPWAVALKEEILRRRMPPWGAVKGFGEFRNDQGLNSEELERLISWIDGGVPEGEEKDLPPIPKFDTHGPDIHTPTKGSLDVKDEYKITRAFTLDGIVPKTLPQKSAMKVYAELPDGSVEPLLWLDTYNPKFPHSFLYRAPLNLPAGTMIRGIAPGAVFTLLAPGPAAPATSASR